MADKKQLNGKQSADLTAMMSDEEEAFERASEAHQVMNGPSMLSAMDHILSDHGHSHNIVTNESADEPSGGQSRSVASTLEPKPAVLGSISSRLGNTWDGVADNVRGFTPAIIVNQSSRLAFASRATADTLSLVSGLKYNSWMRSAASGTSLAGLALGLVYDEKPRTEEERNAIKEMPMLDYVGMRLKQGFDPKNHILATVGLATIPNGLLMATSGISQSRKGHISMEVWQGLMTTAAGLALNLIPNQDRAWQWSTGIFLARIPVSYSQASSAYYQGKPSVSWAKALGEEAKATHSGEQIVVSMNNERHALTDYLQPRSTVLDTWELKGGKMLSQQEVADALVARTQTRLDDVHVQMTKQTNPAALADLQKMAERESGRIELYRQPNFAFNATKEATNYIPYKGQHYVSQEWKAVPGDWQQMGKFWFNQLQNVIGFLYGGVKKDEQGNIIRLQKQGEIVRDEAEVGLFDKPTVSIQSPTQLAERLVAVPEHSRDSL